MPTLAGTRLPTLSEIANWDVGHLERAAFDWTWSANDWEDHFDTLHGQVMSPGGTAWEGAAADAAQHRSFSDLRKVRGIADNLRNAAGIARRGADELLHARSNVLSAVAAAKRAGLVVGEDLSVTVSLTGGSASEQARQLASARRLADMIADGVRELSAVDEKVAAAITAARAPVGEVQFTESPIQLVDNRTYKEGPPTPVPGTPDGPSGGGSGPTAAEIREVIMKLPQGSRPNIREIRTLQDLQNLWKWMRQDGVEMPNGYDDPAKGIRVMLPDGSEVGRRFVANSTNKPALDVNIPGERRDLKVHINPRGGIPNIPSVGGPPIVEAPSTVPKPIESPQMRSGGLVGGLVPDGTLPHLVHPPQAGDPDLPVIGDGIPDHPAQ